MDSPQQSRLVTPQNNWPKLSTTLEICRLRHKLSHPTLSDPQTVAPIDSQIAFTWAAVWFRPLPVQERRTPALRMRRWSVLL